MLSDSVRAITPAWLETRTQKKKRKAALPQVGVTALPGRRVPVAIKESDEDWSEFLLTDGTTLRLRHLVLDAFRVEGQYAQDGQPIYEIKGGNLVEVVAPKKLRRKN